MEQLNNFYAAIPELSGMSSILAMITALLIVSALAFVAHFIARNILLKYLERIIRRTKTKRDDILVNQRVFNRLVPLAPALVLNAAIPAIFAAWPHAEKLAEAAVLLFIILTAILFIDALINGLVAIYNTYPVSNQVPVKSFVQVAKLALYFAGFIIALSVVLGESPLTFLTGLGALTAVLMLVFRDPILGFVAGIQLSANRMLAVGDWIEMPKYGVDGDVMEVALTTVKIRNFDKTITTVPTQALINDSFKNWRGMKETGGRRIKRQVFVDMSTIRICDEDMLRRYQKIDFIRDYLREKTAELDKHNQETKADLTALANGRRLTNIGTFRAYIEACLRNNPKISKSLTFLVRQLQSTEKGLPIEIYVFSLDTDWIAYEKLQADIFDHILAIAPEFDLAVFQNPSGNDLRRLTITASGTA